MATRKQTLTQPAPPILLTQAEALAFAASFEERLSIMAGAPLPEKTIEELRLLCTGHRPYGVKLTSGGWVYHFYIHRRGRRLAVKKLRAPRNLPVERLADILKSTYSCPECHQAFPRRGRRRYCSTACKVAFRRRKRNGWVWSAENLSPEAQTNVAISGYVRSNHEAARDAMARKEQFYQRTIGRSRPKINAGATREG